MMARSPSSTTRSFTNSAASTSSMTPKRFWNEIDKILADYRERKDWLKKNGAALDI